jgi:hypothetical protein
LTPFSVILRVGPRGGEKSIFWEHFWPPKTENCYIVVSTFFGPSGPPSDPPKSDFFWPPLDEKYRRFCGEWHFYRTIYRGRFWGSKSGEFLQKSAKFQKIPFLGVRVPEVEIYRFFIILDPPMANQFLTFFSSKFDPPKSIVFSVIFWSFITTPFYQFISSLFWSIFSHNFKLIFISNFNKPYNHFL